MYQNPFETTPIGTKPQPGKFNDPFSEGSLYQIKTEVPTTVKAPEKGAGFLKLTAPKIDFEAPAGQAITAPKIEGEPGTAGTATGLFKFLSPFARAGQKAFNVISEAVTGGLNRLDKFFDVVTKKEVPVGEKVLIGTEAVLGAGTVAFSPIMAMFDAAEELPIIKYAAKPANWAFQKLGEAGAWAGGVAIDAINYVLPENYKLSQEELNMIKPAAQEIGSLFTMIKGIELTTRVVGGKKVGPETQKLLDKGREAPDTLTPYEKLQFNSVVDSLKADNFWNKGIVKTFQDKLGKGIEKLKANGEVITYKNVDKIISDAVKETPLPVNPGEMTITAKNIEPIKIATDNKIVLQKLIRDNENIDYVKVKDLGKDINGEAVASKFEWDYKKQKGTIYVTKNSTAENIAHELGHYFDHATSLSTQKTLSELMINKSIKPKAVERSLASYVVKKKGGSISAKEITSGVKETLAKMEKDIERLAEKKGTPQEKFARAFSKVTTDPAGTTKIAPEFTAFIQYALAKEGMELPKVRPTTMGVTPKGILSPKESKKIAMDNVPSNILEFKEKTISIRIANELIKRGMDPTEAGTIGDWIAKDVMTVMENTKGIAEKTQAFIETVTNGLRGTIMKELPGEKQQVEEYLQKRGVTKFREGIEIEQPVAKAVRATFDEGTVSSGFHERFSKELNGLEPSWAIVYLGKISSEIKTSAEKAGLKTNIREVPKGTGHFITDVYLPNVKQSETAKATGVFDKFADLYGQVSKGKQKFREAPDLTTQFLEYAKGKTTLSRQEIMDFARRPELKKGEADLLLKKLEEFKSQEARKYKSAEEFVGSQSEIREIQKGITELKNRLKKPAFRDDPVSNQAIKSRISEETNLLERTKSQLTDIWNQAVKETNKIPAQEFADSIRRDLLELKPVKVTQPQFISTVVEPTSIGKRGKLASNYEEVVFESPIVTNGSSHYPNSKKYFAHARGDEVVESGKKIWREQEIQSDLLQKGGLERAASEFESIRSTRLPENVKYRGEEYKLISGRDAIATIGETPSNVKIQDVKTGETKWVKFQNLLKENPEFVSGEKISQFSQLQPFTNDRFGERIMRERIKEKAQQGYDNYRLPTGETIGKIEGVGGFDRGWWRVLERKGKERFAGADVEQNLSNVKVGTEVFNRGGERGAELDSWIITDILGDGRFKAVPKREVDLAHGFTRLEGKAVDSPEMKTAIGAYSETFDLTGKSNPQYRRYSDWGKFLKNRYGGKEVTDPQGNTWMEIDLKKEYAKEPVMAFRTAPMEAGPKLTPGQEKQITELNRKIFGDQDIKIAQQILTPEGRRALGSYRDRMIEIVDGQADPKASFYHEAVHKYLDVLTTQAEQVDLILEAKKRFGAADFKQAEEILAEKFINYAKSREGVMGSMKLMFDKVIARIKTYLGSADKIDTFYTEVLGGKVGEGTGWSTTTTGPPMIAGTGLKTGKFVEGRPAFNLDKINAPQDVERVIKTIAKETDQFKTQRISKSNADIEKLAFEVGVTPEDLIKTQPGSIANAETVLKARRLVMDLAADLRNTIKQITTETATPEQLKEIRQKIFRLQGTMKAVAGLRTEASNIFRQFQIEAAIGENDIMKSLLSELKVIDAESAGDISKFSNKVKTFLEPTFAEKAWHIWYMNILSGVSTQIKNTFGNISNMGAEIARVAITRPAELPKALEGLYQGLIKGRDKAAGIMKVGDVSKFEERGIKPIVFTGDTPVGKAIATGLNSMDYVGRFMSAVDAIFREGFRGMELYGQAREMALKEGLTGEALNKRITDIVAEPLQEMIESVDKFAQRGVYTQKPTGVMGWLSNTISRATTVGSKEGLGMKITKGVARTIVPFTRIVANVVNNGLDWTPVGFMREGLPKNLFERKALSRVQHQELGRAVMGTVAMTYLASLATNGILSGSGPAEKKERETLYASGWRPNSIKIRDTWYPYSNWGPMAIPMALVANYNDAIKYGNMEDKDTFDRTTMAVLNTTQSILDMSFLNGLSDLMVAVKEKDPTYFKRYIASQATTPVPNLFKQIARYFDTTQYEANTVKEYILSNLRITSGLKPRLNVFGDVVKGEALTQLQPVRETSDPLIKYLAVNELWISIPSKATMVVDRGTGEKRKMTPDEYYKYVEISGKAIKETLTRNLGYLETLEADQERQQDFIDKIVQTERNRAKQMIQ